MVQPFAPYALEYGEGFRKKRGQDLGSLATMLVMLTAPGAGGDLLDRGLAVAAAVLRGPAAWGASGEEDPIGGLQLLAILGVVVLLVLLAGVVIWRIYRTRPFATRS